MGTTKTGAKLLDDNILRGVCISVDTFGGGVTRARALENLKQIEHATAIVKSVYGVPKSQQRPEVAMDNNIKRTAKVPALLTLAGFIIVVAAMKAASSVLVFIFLAVFIAVICTNRFSGCNARASRRSLRLSLFWWPSCLQDPSLEY